MTEEKPETEEIDIDQRARNLGWKSEEEFEGAGKWIPAEEFIQKGEEALPLLRADIRKMQQNFELQNKTHKMAFDAQEKRLEREYKEKLETAVEEGDLQKYRELRKEEDDLQSTNGEDPDELAGKAARGQFIVDNPWYGKDRAMTASAGAFSADVADQFPDLTPEQNLEKTLQMIKDEFPHKFGERKMPTPQPSPVEGGRKIKRKTEKNYSSMPEEDRAACDRAATIGLSSKEDFVKNYWEIYDAM
jgi:hypothetical protein